MIDAKALLTDLKRLLRTLETDIRDRVEGSPQEDGLRADWQAARDAKRTAQTFAAWLDEEVTQAAVHWVLACVFLRFVEDNGLVERPWLSGPGERLELARDRHDSWIRANPTGEERDFLLDCFAEAAELPGLGALFDRRHNPLWRLPVSGDGAIALRGFWQKRDPDSGALLHDFTDPEFGTRFLGDLYQDLSEAARKRFALLQTPEFVEEFILDRTLDPAIREFGFRAVRLIDPTCGSGHFLLGAFRRLFDLWTRQEPGRNVRDCAQQALDAVSGVDVNPFAAAIARFRLLVAALTACGIASLRGAPDFHISVAVGDSLLHGKRFMDVRGWQMSFDPQGGLAHVSFEEDREALDRILGRQYHAVVGNPPYITVKDKALNQAYRERFSTCHMKYSLGVPFTERFWDLALPGIAAAGTAALHAEDGARASGPSRRHAGFIGMITANSFMKREFGKKLIEVFLPQVDLTHVIDTAGAYIPGHGTPTVILFGRNQRPVGTEVRAAMGIKGEPGAPDDPSHGLVWSSIVGGIDRPGSEDAFVSITDLPRTGLAKHPWSMGGGGASDLLDLIGSSDRKLGDASDSIGFMIICGDDDSFVVENNFSFRSRTNSRPYCTGESIRDWGSIFDQEIIYPYTDAIGAKIPEKLEGHLHVHFWKYRVGLKNRKMFGKSPEDHGLQWNEYIYFSEKKFYLDSKISFASVATHNHFYKPSKGVVHNRHSPIISINDKFDGQSLLSLLNSSVACFWMKQIFHNKGSTIDQKGARQRTDPFEDFYEFTGTGLQSFPLAEPYPTDLGTALDSLARELTDTLPQAVLARGVPTRADLDAAKARALSVRRRMIALQEELDFRCYKLYGLIDTPVEAGARASGPSPVAPVAVGTTAPRGPKGWHGRGYLPHFDSPDTVQSVTFRLADSLPAEVVAALKDGDDPTSAIDDDLDAGRGACHLSDPRIAAIVADALRHFDGQRYRLHAWTIMPNHVHALIEPMNGHSLSTIVQSWKSFTAKEANRILGTEGRFWQPDYFDRFIRDEEQFHRTRVYIENNPVKAGLCADARAWRFGSAWDEQDGGATGTVALPGAGASGPSVPEVDLGERAFEIVMARKMADGELETTWFARHGSTPVTEIPARWPADYRALVERRIALIAENRWIELVERPEYKRRWQWDDQGFDAGWHKREQAALKEWLLDRLEDPRHWPGDPALISVVRLADRARGDADFMAVAELYTGRPDFDAAALVAELVAAESVPFLPVQRYTDEGLRKRRDWEATWDLQRREDVLDARTELPDGHPDRLSAEEAKALKPDIPVPPKYKRTDFRSGDFWRLRGGLDVPKERFVSYPGAERDSDGSLVIAWAGYDHLQQATALASHYYDMKENEGWGTERLIPLLAGVWELVPWLVQWHNEYNPDFGVGLGDYYRSFVEDEARALGLTADDLRAWTPPARPAARRGRKAS